MLRMTDTGPASCGKTGPKVPAMQQVSAAPTSHTHNANLSI